MIDTNVHETRKSEYYDMLAWMGLLGTEDGQIRDSRSRDAELYEDFEFSYNDIGRVGYLHPHFYCNPKYKGYMELWIENHYINPEVITWIETTNVLYGVLDKPYKDEIERHVIIKCFYNPNIVYRYSYSGEQGTLYRHTDIIDISDSKFAGIEDITKCVYYISNDKFYIPRITHVSGTKYKIYSEYTSNIDLFICTNLVNVVKVRANIGIPVIHPTSNICYHRMFVDHDPVYPIDCRFYPYIKVNKSAVVRVFSDLSHKILNPVMSRLVNYSEYSDITDPYNTTNEYFRSLQPVDDIITTKDSDEELMEKFKKISAYCYRMWETYPWNPNEQSDFVVCDNKNFGNPCFIKREIKTSTGTISKICTTVPFESYRDLLFYKGSLFSDYSTMRISYKVYRTYSAWIEIDNGMLVYIIDDQYDPNEFALIKFNAFEDSTYINLDHYFNSDFINRLHFKMNRFYRNLLVIRNEYNDTIEPVRVSTVQPTIKDKYLWYELLVNAVPEMFEKKMVDLINLYGLDPNNIPDDVMEGAYMLELEPQDGPASYSKMLMTYFNLSKAKRDYLALQYDNPEDDPRFKKYDHANIGKASDFEIESEYNHLLLEDNTLTFSSGQTEYEYGRPANPGIHDWHTAGNLYGQTLPKEPPPGFENIDIAKIETGPQEPYRDPEHTFWIDTGTNYPFDTVWDADVLDGVTTHITYTSDVETIDAEVSDYAIETRDGVHIENDDISISELLDGVRDGLSPIPPGNADIDGLLDGIVGPDDVPLTATTLAEELGQVVADNIQVSNIQNPTNGMLALDDIGYMHSDTWLPYTMEEIEEMSTDDKINILRKLFTDDDEPTDARLGDYWIKYLSTKNTLSLNTIVYRVLLTARAQFLTHVALGDLAIEGIELPEDWATLAYGEYPEWTKPKQMIITPMVEDEDGNLRPDYDIIKQNLLNYFYHYMPDMGDNDYGPDDPIEGDLWLDVDANTLVQLIKDLISESIIEFGIEPPDGVYYETDHDVYATMGFDYGAHDSPDTETSDEWHEVRDNKLYPVNYGHEPPNPVTIDEGDLWYEFLDTIDNRVAYSDKESMVIRVDERLLLVTFDHDNIQTYAFDDIIMNFRGKLGLRYMTLLADLINSGEINLENVNFFWKRLLTYGDEFDPKMHRLYTGKSFVVSTPKIDTDDYSVIYSTNIGRFRINYAAEETGRKEREAAYRMCIDYTAHEDFAFLENRMIVFINGKYIPRTNLKEVAAYMLYVENFNEVISTVDIFYMKKDRLLMDMKRAAYRYWPQPDISDYIERPDYRYNTMEKIKVYDYTYKGYYDVLLYEFIFSGKLQAMLNYIEENPELAEDYRRDLVHKFHAISDTDLSNMKHHDSRIIIPAFGESIDTPYQIGYQEPLPDYHIWDDGF